MERIQTSWRVLIVDDDEAVRDVIVDLLAEQGFEVRHAASRAEAMLELHRREFDVVLGDLRLLRSENGQLISRTRALQPETRLVAMSATGIPETGRDTDRGLPKPFSRVQLMEAVQPA